MSVTLLDDRSHRRFRYFQYSGLLRIRVFVLVLANQLSNRLRDDLRHGLRIVDTYVGWRFLPSTPAPLCGKKQLLAAQLIVYRPCTPSAASDVPVHAICNATNATNAANAAKPDDATTSSAATKY